MTKHPRNPHLWTNAQIEQDSEGYLAAQAAYDADQAKEQDQRREADDERRFTSEFVRNGGRASDAPAAFRKHRNEQAAEAAAQENQEALLASQHHIRGNL